MIGLVWKKQSSGGTQKNYWECFFIQYKVTNNTRTLIVGRINILKVKVSPAGIR